MYLLFDHDHKFCDIPEISDILVTHRKIPNLRDIKTKKITAN